MLNYAGENDLLKNLQRKLISSFELENGTKLIPLLKFILNLKLNVQNVYLIVEYTPIKCLNKFVQSVVDARRDAHENPHPRVVAETMKLLISSFYGYQIMDRTRPDTHKTVTKKFCKRLNVVKKKIYTLVRVTN